MKEKLGRFPESFTEVMESTTNFLAGNKVCTGCLAVKCPQ